MSHIFPEMCIKANAAIVCKYDNFTDEMNI